MTPETARRRALLGPAGVARAQQIGAQMPPLPPDVRAALVILLPRPPTCTEEGRSVNLATQPLSTVEADDLASAEATIRAGLDTFVDVGRALLAIRDGQLYRTTHGRFEDYCRERWELSSSRARRLIDATDIVQALEDQSVPLGTLGSSGAVAPLPTSERQARPLTQLRDDPDAVRQTWQRAVDTAPGGKVTAAHVEQAVRDELAARRDEIEGHQAETERRRQATEEFNQATAHLVQQANTERPYAHAAVSITYAIERLPLDMDPVELAANVPATSAYRLDDIPRVVSWLTRLHAARQERATA